MSKVLEQAPDGEADEEERGIKPATGKLETIYSLKLKAQMKGKFTDPLTKTVAAMEGIIRDKTGGKFIFNPTSTSSENI